MMALDPSLAFQNIQYSQYSGYPQSHGPCSTYDSPLSSTLDGAYSTSRRISLQLLHDRAKIYPKYHSTMTIERSASSGSRISLGSIKRSVPGMKTLLPLKLLSPTLPEFDTWPPPEPVKRSTFGTRIISQDIEYTPAIGDRARDSLQSRKRSRQYRDTPIYSEPGSPVPSRAYFSDDDVGFHCSQPGSTSEADGIIQDFIDLKEAETIDDEEQQDGAEGTHCTVKCISRKPSATPTPRWSELSFQCSGEALYENESIWLRSAMSKANSASKLLVAVGGEGDYVERTVESWLSDTSSSFEHEDEILACATALSSSRAQVIDLRVSRNHPTDLSLHIPARSSSLMGTSAPENNFWETFGTPPITPSEPWEHDSHNEQQMNKDTLILPKRRLDLAMPSPPLSPRRSPAMVASRSMESSKKRRTTRLPVPVHDTESQWPLPSPNISQRPLMDVTGSLESLISSFPSSILLPDSPCISAIRSRNTQPVASSSISPLTSPTLLESPFGQDFPRPPSYQPIGIPKSKNFSSHRRDFSFSTASSLPPYRYSPSKRSSNQRSSSLPVPVLPPCLPPPDLSPLLRIFPKTSEFMCSALYAYIVAHIFITSLSLPTYKSPANGSSGRRRDTPHWPTSLQAANILGISQNLDSTGDSADRQLQFKGRVLALEQNIRKCIYCLTGAMDSNLGIEDMTEFDDNSPDFNNGKLFIRTLEEVVKICEERSNGIDGMP